MYPKSTNELTDNSDPLMVGKICAVILCPDGRCKVPKWVDDIDCPLATVTFMCWSFVHSCTSDKQLMSLNEKYSPVDPESALAL